MEGWREGGRSLDREGDSLLPGTHIPQCWEKVGRERII